MAINKRKKENVIDQAYMCAHARLITFFSLLDRQEKEGWPRDQNEFLWTSWNAFKCPKHAFLTSSSRNSLIWRSSLTGHFSHLLTHLCFFLLCVKREKNVDRLVENAKRQDLAERIHLKMTSWWTIRSCLWSLSQRFLFSCVRSQAHWPNGISMPGQHKKRMKHVSFLSFNQECAEALIVLLIERRRNRDKCASSWKRKRRKSNEIKEENECHQTFNKHFLFFYHLFSSFFLFHHIFLRRNQ